METQEEYHPIYDFLELDHRVWHVELEISDFKEKNVAKLLDLPVNIYKKNPKAHFWAFLKVFLQECEIAFINRKYPPGVGITPECKEMALLGYWDGEEKAIPLWKLDDLLLGFEIISQKEYKILNTKPLCWVYPLVGEQVSFMAGKGVVALDEDLFRKQKIFFELKRCYISFSAFDDEEDFFERIANTDIPEIDDCGDSLES